MPGDRPCRSLPPRSRPRFPTSVPGRIWWLGLCFVVRTAAAELTAPEADFVPPSATNVSATTVASGTLAAPINNVSAAGTNAGPVLPATTNAVPAAPPAATNAPPVVGAQTPTLADVTAEIARIEADSSLEAKLKQAALEQYRAAAQLLTSAEQSRQQTAALKAASANAQEEANRLREQLKQMDESTLTRTNLLADILTNAPLAELEPILTQAKADADAAKTQRNQDEQALNQRRKRPESAVAEKATTQAELREAETQLNAPPPPDLAPLAAQARRALLEARRAAATARLELIEQDLIAQPGQVALLTARQNLRARESALASSRAAALEALVEAKRTAAAEAERSRAQQAEQEASADEAHPLIRDLAQQNTDLAAQRASVIELNRQVSNQLKAAEEAQRRLDLSESNARKQMEAAGLSKALAEILLLQRRRLDSPRNVEKSMEGLSDTISTNALAQLRVDEELRQLVVIPERAQELLASRTDAPTDEAERATLLAEATEFLKKRQEYLSGLQESYSLLLENLRMLAGGQSIYLRQLEEYIDFLDQHLMWTPSSAPLGPRALAALPAAIEWWLAPGNWGALGRAFARWPSRAPLPAGMPTLILLLLLLSRKRLAHALDRLATPARRASTDSFRLTLKALLVTTLLAVPFAWATAVVGWALLSDPNPEGSEFIYALASACLQMSGASLIFFGLYEICRPRGLAEVHFRWREEHLRLLRRNLLWFAPIMLAVTLVTTATDTQARDEIHNGAGRLVFIAGMVAFLIFNHRVLHPRHGVLAEAILQRPGGALARLKWLWFAALQGTPLALIGLAALGYFYTALQLHSRVGWSMALILILTLVYNLVLRWLFVRERRLALEQALEKRAQAAQKAGEGSAPSEAMPQVEEPEVSLGVIKAQTRQLLRVSLGLAIGAGLWLIWESELPALNYLHNFRLWSVSAGVEGARVQVPVTLADLLGAVVVGLLTAVAARNLPGLLEITLLQNLSLQPGSRYAITAISQYVVAFIGIALTLGALGLRWSQLGWIAAALSVGLGFGLQEVVANFVCGILLFLERPVRVGDIVTVGDVTGVVSRIQIRATTITNWERQEFIVPNKELITGRILNWTLSNPVNRVTIEVGVAYGSDVDRTREVLLRVASEHPLLLNDPAPMAHFVGFGDSTLNFTVRGYLPDLDNRLNVIHELNRAIYLGLAAAGVEIAFPQRDIHIRSIEPVLRLARKEKPTA